MSKPVYVKNLWETNDRIKEINLNDNLEITDEWLTIDLCDKISYVYPDHIVEVNRVSMQIPIVLDDGTINIDPDYYDKNRKKVDEFVLRVIEAFKG